MFEETIGIYNQGLQLLNQNNLQKAIEAFDHAVKYFPMEKFNYAMSGYLVDLDGQGEAKLIAMICNSRGTAKYDMRDYQGALNDYNYAITLNPDSPDAYFNRARIYKDQKEYQNALFDYNKAIDLKENFRQESSIISAYQNRAAIKSALGDIQGLLSDLEEMANLCKKQGLLEEFLNVQNAIRQTRLLIE